MSCRYSFPAVRINKRFVTAPAAGALCSTAWNRRKTKCIWYPSVVNFGTTGSLFAICSRVTRRFAMRRVRPMTEGVQPPFD